jgi:hypothetical protein
VVEGGMQPPNQPRILSNFALISYKPIKIRFHPPKLQETSF